MLILANGLLSMSEIALVSTRKSKIATQAKSGDKSAKMVEKLGADPDKFFSIVQIGITLIGIITGIYSADALSADFAKYFENIGVPQEYSGLAAKSLIVVVATYLTLVFGELVPKKIGFSAPEQIAKIVAPLMLALSSIAYPFVWILSKSTAAVTKILGIKNRDTGVTEDEIKQMIAEGAKTGEVLSIEKNIVERTFTLGDRRVAAIMTPRPDVVGIEIDAKKNDIIKILEETPHVVYPVYRKTLDDILGAVSIKDLIVEIEKPDFKLQSHIREICFFNEFVKVYDALEILRKKKSKYSVILGEFGITMGVVTMNDVMDALLGNMPEKGEEPDIVEREDGTLLLDGQCPFYDFILKTNSGDAKDVPFNTVGGMILTQTGRIPNEGDKVEWGNFVLEVVDMDGIRIDKVLAYKKPQEEIKEEE